MESLHKLIGIEPFLCACMLLHHCYSISVLEKQNVYSTCAVHYLHFVCPGGYLDDYSESGNV